MHVAGRRAPVNAWATFALGTDMARLQPGRLWPLAYGLWPVACGLWSG